MQRAPHAASQRSWTQVQNLLHQRLQRLCNGEATGRQQKLTQFLAPASVRRAQAREAVRLFADCRAQAQAAASPAQDIIVAPYTGVNTSVRAMIAALRALSDQLRAAVVHGSLATGEEIPYSDFDALVIIRNEVMQDHNELASLAQQLASLRRIMLEHDPLQHHGWFVLTEADLASHCEAYFPLALFAHSRSLLPDRPCQLVCAARDSSAEFLASFSGLSRQLAHQIAHGSWPENAYELKSFTSRVMMLPALYLQARHGKTTYKKDSFALARGGFSDQLWSAMDAVSELRRDWDCETAGLRRRVLCRPGPARRLLARYASPPVPRTLRPRLTAELWQNVGRLVDAMQDAINKAGAS